MVRDVFDAIDQRIAHVHILMIHVDLGTKDAFALFEFPPLHPFEQIETLLGRAIAPRAFFARRIEIPAIFANLLRRQFAYIRLATAYQFLRPCIQLVEIIRCKIQCIPIKSKPTHIFFDRIAILRVFFHWVGIVETQIARSSKLLRQAKIQADRFRMTNVEITIGLGRETRRNAPAILAVFQILFDDFSHEIRTDFNFCHISSVLCTN